MASATPPPPPPPRDAAATAAAAEQQQQAAAAALLSEALAASDAYVATRDVRFSIGAASELTMHRVVVGVVEHFSTLGAMVALTGGGGGGGGSVLGLLPAYEWRDRAAPRVAQQLTVRVVQLDHGGGGGGGGGELRVGLSLELQRLNPGIDALMQLTPGAALRGRVLRVDDARAGAALSLEIAELGVLRAAHLRIRGAAADGAPPPMSAVLAAGDVIDVSVVGFGGGGGSVLLAATVDPPPDRRPAPAAGGAAAARRRRRRRWRRRTSQAAAAGRKLSARSRAG